MPTRLSKLNTTGVRRAGLLCLAALLGACSTTHRDNAGRYSQHQDTAPARAVDVSLVADATPRAEPKSRYGNPASYVVRGKRYATQTSSKGYRERGIASWYGTKFHGHRTSSGESYDMYKMSAAHKTLPLPTYARVTNLRNGKSVIVKINDRGPFHDNRLIDLSYAAASRLEILGKGTGLVEVEAIDPLSYAGDSTRPVRHVTVSQPKLAPTPLAPEPVAADSAAAPPSLYLQLGAFLSRSNAERLQQRLSTATLPGKLHISETVSNQKHIYRVRIGPLANVETADRLTRSLAEQGIASPHVVID